MAKRSNLSAGGSSPSLLGSLMGMFNFHQVNVCTSSDNSFYCTLMRLVQSLIAIIVLCVILYVIYVVAIKPAFSTLTKRK